jgi:Domain of unknown function (DUF6901)
MAAAPPAAYHSGGVPSATEPASPLRFRYTLTFADGTRQVFDIRIDPATLSLIEEPPASPPDWTALGFHQCPNCPLDPAPHPHCPVALNLVSVVEAFKDRASYDKVDVVVEARQRTYSRHVPLQTAASSLIGLYMPTSGCPILDSLRPLVETHLPFMNRTETLHRMLAMYLLTQYVRHRAGQPADWDLAGLAPHLEEIHTVNVAFCQRLNAAPTKDASVNAVVILSALGEFPSHKVTARYLDHLARVLGVRS